MQGKPPILKKFKNEYDLYTQLNWFSETKLIDIGWKIGTDIKGLTRVDKIRLLENILSNYTSDEIINIIK